MMGNCHPRFKGEERGVILIHGALAKSVLAKATSESSDWGRPPDPMERCSNCVRITGKKKFSNRKYKSSYSGYETSRDVALEVVYLTEVGRGNKETSAS